MEKIPKDNGGQNAGKRDKVIRLEVTGEQDEQALQ